jgi:hypothetical protein
MITGFSTQTIGGSFVDTQGQRYQVKTTWVEEAGISSIWIEESLNWWDSILLEDSNFLLTESQDYLTTEQVTNLNWSKETMGSTTWIKENI